MACNGTGVEVRSTQYLAKIKCLLYRTPQHLAVRLIIIRRQDAADAIESQSVSYWGMSDVGEGSWVVLGFLFDRAVGLWRWTTLRACETSKRML
jgi:hypothetical protein